jgi:predicted dienelactone hydrolase
MGGRTKLLRFMSVFTTTAVFALGQPSGDTPGGLLLPTGAFRVGRVTLVCEDASRLEPLDPNAAARRIIVDVWYPTGSSGPQERPAEYLNVAEYERALGADGLRKHLGGAYSAIKSGGVATHSIEHAPFAGSLRLAPVLLFSPGAGMIRELYTSQMEDLASHGYVIAAMTHSYDGFLAIFPDGTSIRSDERRWPRIPSVEGEANLNQLEWHTLDFLAVLDHLKRLSSATSSQFPIAGHLDLTRVGAFGHSFGGVAAAHACQKDQQFKACLNQDGAMGMKPFYLDAHDWGMNQAFMLIERPPNREPLTESDLTAMKLTRARAMDLIARLNSQRDRALRSTGSGSYRVLLRRNATTHMDFSDLQVLSAQDRIQLKERMQVLELVTSYTRAFFDRHVRGVKAPLLDRGKPDEVLESVERFSPSRRRTDSARYGDCGK